jgi:hypothetical protein
MLGILHVLQTTVTARQVATSRPQQDCMEGNVFGASRTVKGKVEVLSSLWETMAKDSTAAMFSPMSTSGHGAHVSRVNLLPTNSHMIVDPSKCREAGFICDECATLATPNDDVTSLVDIVTVNDLQHDFFVEPSLGVGAKMLLDRNLQSPIPRRSFLPQQIAEEFPTLTEENLSTILETFKIRSGTPMADVIKTAVRLCGSPALPGEERACPTSFEAMMDFVAAHLGDDVEIMSTTGAPTEAPVSKAPVTVTAYRKHSAEEGKHIVVCHDLFFPTALYYCHFVHDTKLVDARLSTSANDQSQHTIDALAVCHLNTALWKARHPAFAALHIPRGSEACHYITERDLVFVKVDATSKE